MVEGVLLQLTDLNLGMTTFSGWIP
eukprot:SAG31_NODE_24725_length_475_cov_1.087766_1_plen_24_part_10